VEPGCRRDAKPDTSRVAAGNRSKRTTHRTSRRSGCIDPWQQHSAGRRCSTRRALHLGSATLLVNRERPTSVSGAACHRDIRCVRRRDGHAIRGNRERRGFSSASPALQSADGVRRGLGHSATRAGYPMLPERCSWRIGEARLQGFTPLENPYPSRCGLDSVRADALMGFRLLRDFSPGPARNAFAPSTSTSFAALLTRRS
jgi:hypothetical protein